MLIKSKYNAYDLKYSLVWTTKDRNPLFDKGYSADEMFEVLTTIAKNNRMRVLKLQITHDTVTMNVTAKPSLSPSIIAKSLKGGSARIWLHRYPELKHVLDEGKLWSSSYLVTTMGVVDDDLRDNYVNGRIPNTKGLRSKKKPVY